MTIKTRIKELERASGKGREVFIFETHYESTEGDNPDYGVTGIEARGDKNTTWFDRLPDETEEALWERVRAACKKEAGTEFIFLLPALVRLL